MLPLVGVNQLFDASDVHIRAWVSFPTLLALILTGRQVFEREGERERERGGGRHKRRTMERKTETETGRDIQIDR